MNTLKDFLDDLSQKVAEEHYKQIESWLKEHWTHKSELIQYPNDNLTLRGKCPCGEHMVFRIEIRHD